MKSKWSFKKLFFVTLCLAVVFFVIAYISKEYNPAPDAIQQVDIKTGNPWGGNTFYQLGGDGSLKILSNGKLGFSRLNDGQFEKIVEGLTGLQKIAKPDWKEPRSIEDGPFSCFNYTHDSNWFSLKWTEKSEATKRMSFSTGCSQVTYPAQMAAGLVGIYFDTAGNEIRMTRLKQRLDEIGKGADWRIPTIDEYEEMVGFKLSRRERELFRQRQDTDRKIKEQKKDLWHLHPSQK